LHSCVGTYLTAHWNRRPFHRLIGQKNDAENVDWHAV
jgi:hypothetical protein